MKKSTDIISRFFPEYRAGGFTSLDGTVEFYGRVNALLTPDMTVLDLGAGRAAWFEDDDCAFRKSLRMLKGKCRKVVGCDVDRQVLQNRTLDDAVVIDPNAPLPFADESFDLIVADFTFEHIDDPERLAAELTRILKKGGWVCARTPNKFGYVSILTRLVRNSLHSRVLKFAQPERREIDVFPTRFRLNTKGAVSRHFPPERFENFTYHYEAEPAYFFNRRLVFMVFLAVNKLLPRFLHSSLFVFLRKK